MIEIIGRCDGQWSSKQQIGGYNPQISYNSDGRLVIRLINGDHSLADQLIVLDADVSEKVIGFCQKSLAPLKADKNGKDDDIPF